MKEKKSKSYIKQSEQINSISDLFSILSHPVRIKILWLLKNKQNLSVHELQKELKISQ